MALSLPAVHHKNIVFCVVNLLLTKLVRSRWLDIGFVLFFCLFRVYRPRRSCVHKQTKNELGQYPAIITSRLDNNPHTAFSKKVAPVIRDG